jgi:hypothetical protein
MLDLTKVKIFNFPISYLVTFSVIIRHILSSLLVFAIQEAKIINYFAIHVFDYYILFTSSDIILKFLLLQRGSLILDKNLQAGFAKIE